MQSTPSVRDGCPVVLFEVPSGGPPVIFDPPGWEALLAHGVTSIVAQSGHIVARVGKRQTAAARVVWGDSPPARIVHRNDDRRDLRRANLADAAEGRLCKAAEPKVPREKAARDAAAELIAAHRKRVAQMRRHLWRTHPEWRAEWWRKHRRLPW